MRKPWIRWFYVGLLAIVIFAFGIPIVINECYKSNSGYTTLWSAADVLSYYGTILGALVAITTIIVTIGFTRKQIWRESFLKNETEKWSKIEGVFAVALDAINPIRPMNEAMDTGMTDPSTAIIAFQKYQMSCKTAMDQLIAFLSGSDYPKVKELLDCVNQATEEFSRICDKEIAIYISLRDFSSRQTAETTMKTEADHPHSFSENTLTFCRTIIEKTNGVTLDAINKDLAVFNGEMVSAYETKYRGLLKLKGQPFETINAEIQKKADSILFFGGKSNADT